MTRSTLLISLLTSFILFILNILTPNIVNAQIFFSEKFDHDLSSWETHSTTGEWKIVEKELLGVATSSSHPPQPSYALAGSSEWKDYSLYVKIKGNDRPDKQIIFRVTDDGSYYVLNIVGDYVVGGNQVILAKKSTSDFITSDDVVSVLHIQHYVNKSEEWYNVRIDVKNIETGVSMKIYINDIFIFEKIDKYSDNPNLNGRIGFEVWPGGKSESSSPTINYFDDVLVTEYNYKPTLDLPVENLKQYDLGWGNETYNNASTWAETPTIESWGCALTSATMVLRYYDYDIWPNTLNDWLKNQPDGYIKNGLVNWLAISRYTQRQTSTNSPVLEFQRYNADPAKLKEELLQGRPPILELPGHFIVAKGKEDSDFLINDPASKTELLSILESTRGTHSSINSYIPANTNLSYVMLVVNSSAQIYLFDSTGNPVSANSYIQEPLQNNLNKSQTGGESFRILLFPKPQNDTYSVTIEGENGPFQLDAYMYDQEGNLIGNKYTPIAGVISDKIPVHFQFTYNNNSVVYSLTDHLSAQTTSVITNKDFYKKGDLLEIQVKVTNSGNLTFDPTKESLIVDIKGPNGFIGGNFHEQYGLSLSPGNSETFTLYTPPQSIPESWSEGDYIIYASIYSARAAPLNHLPGGQNSNTQFIVENTTPVTNVPLYSPSDDSFWNKPIQILGTSTDNFWVDLLHLSYKPTNSSDPWEDVVNLPNLEDDAVFDWLYLWTPVEGVYDIKASAVDAAGNEEKSVYVYNVTFDNTQPTIINVSANKDYVKAGDKLTITAEVTDASGINAVSADFSYNIGYTNRPQPTSVAMQNIGGTVYRTIYTVPSDWNEGIMYIKVAARDGTGGNRTRSNDQDTVIVDNTAPQIIFEIPENGSTHAGTISLRAVCDEDCDYINFWWRSENEPYSSSSKRYHYVPDNGTIFEWDLNSLDAEKWGGDTYLMEDGTYYLYAAGKDLVGNWAQTPNVQIVVDNTAPLVTIESPSDFSFLRGTVNVLGTLIEDVELSHYNFSIYSGTADFNNFSLRLYSDTQYLSTGFTNKLLYEWDTTTWPNGEYLLRFAARDKVGNRDLSGDPYLGGDDSQHVIRVTVDNTNPELSWTSPAEGTVISGTTTVGSDASDTFSGVKSVTYYYQKVGEVGWNALDVKTSAPYETTWDTTGLPLGDYTLRAIAENNAGNQTTIFRSVGVAAVISGEFWSRPGWGEITISWTTDRPTDGRVVYDTVSHPIDLTHPNYGYANTSGTVDTSPKTLSHTVTLSGLSNSTTYYWRTVSAGSPTAISTERRGDTFSIPGGSTSGGGTVAGLTTSVATTPFFYAELEDTSTLEEDSEEVLGEETEIVTEEPETAFDEAVGTLTGTNKGRIAAISAFLLGLILYFLARRRRR